MVAFSAWSMAWLYRKTSWPEWLLLGIVALCCFMPATTVLPIGLSGWQLNIAGIIGLAAVFQWQRLRHYVGAKISAG
jgi:hypothetical protein